MANPGPNIETTAMNLGAVAPGVGRVTMSFLVTLAAITDADFITNWPFTFKGRVLAVDFITHTKASTGSKASTLTSKIVKAGTTTPITGGVLAMTTVACGTAGLVLPGTAITALNSFNRGDGLTLTFSGTTAFGEGAGTLLVTVVNDDTQDAIARGQGVFNP